MLRNRNKVENGGFLKGSKTEDKSLEKNGFMIEKR